MKGIDTSVNKSRPNRPRLSFRNCGLFDNASEGFGGAIYTIHTDIDVIDSIVLGNKASVGGAFYVDNGALNIIRSNFTSNAAAPLGNPPFAGLGGAVYALDTDVYMTDSIMDGNSAVGGEGRQGRGGVLFDIESTRGDTTLNSIRTPPNNGEKEVLFLQQNLPVSYLIHVRFSFSFICYFLSCEWGS